MPTQRQLESFFAIAKAGSFYQAANAMFLSASALIQQINLLEKELGFKLFIRSRAGVVLTPAGEYYLHEAKRLYYEFESIAEAGRRIACNTRTTIRLGYSAQSNVSVALKLSSTIRKHNLPLSVLPEQSPLSHAAELIRSNRLDCFLHPVGTMLRNSGLEYVVVHSFPLNIGFPPTLDDLTASERILPEVLARHQIVLPEPDLFDSADQLRAMLMKINPQLDCITVSDHIETEMVCLEQHACRLSLEPMQGSLLIYKPLECAFSHELALAYDRFHREKAQMLLAVFHSL